MAIAIGDFVAGWPRSILFADVAPWDLTTRAPGVLLGAMSKLGAGYEINDNIAVHVSAVIEPGAIVKGPAIIGPDAFVAATAYLRGGVFLDEGCIIGPACEVKTTFVFAGSKVAHLSFVGDSILGAGVNIEAGAIIANYRNELKDKQIKIVHEGRTIETAVEKFGALVGDDARIGAGAVIAPGALIAPGARLARLSRIDQHPSPLLDG